MEAEQLFHTGNHFAKLGLISLPGSEELTAKIDHWLVQWAAMGPEARDTFVLSAECPRFQSGDAKALLHDRLCLRAWYLSVIFYWKIGAFAFCHH